MNEQSRNFDTEAATWDENPRRIQLVADIFNALQQEVPLHSDMQVLDFGCGTGTLAIHLAPLVASITGADTSKGMLDVFNDKLTKQGVNTIRLVQIAPGEYEALKGPYDLIVSTMTLHHVENVTPLLEHFHSILAPGGYLAIADLDLDDGLFHGENAEVFHNGFDRDVLGKIFADAGLENVRHVTAAEVTKPDANDEMRTFSLFLVTGQHS